MLSQPLWLHVHNFPGRVQKTQFWSSHSRPLVLPHSLPLLLWWSLSLGRRSVIQTSHEEVSNLFASAHWAVVGLCANHHLLQEEVSLPGWLLLLLWVSNLRYFQSIYRDSPSLGPQELPLAHGFKFYLFASGSYVPVSTPGPESRGLTCLDPPLSFLF